MDKAKTELIEEINLLKQRIAELEKLHGECEQQHHQGTRRLATVVIHSNDAIIIQDIDGWITAWNRGAELMYGYNEKEALGMNIERITPPGKVAEQKEFIRRLIAGEASTSFETQRVTKNGSILDVWLTVTKLVEDQADSGISTGRDITRSINLALIERNITERKRAEEGLAKCKNKYQGLFENSHDAIMTLEPPFWKFTSGNLAMVKMFRAKDKDFFTLHDPWSLSPERQPDGRVSVEKAKEMIGMAVRDGSNFFEWTHKRLNGEEFLATVQLTRIALPEEAILQATITDITEPKQAKEILMASERKLKTIFENTTDGIVITDIETKKFHDANNSMCRLLGYSLEELKALRVADIHPNENLAYIMEQIKEQSRDPLAPAVDLPVLRKDGSIFYANVLGTKMNLLGKDYMVAIFRDTTARKKAEDALCNENVRFKALFSNISSGVAIFEAKDEGEDFIFKDINKAGERFSKVVRDQVVGKSLLDVFPGVKKIGLFEVFRQVWKTGESQRHPTSLYQDERMSHWVENYVYKLPSGEIVAVYDDVTEHKKAEEALRTSEKRYRTLFEQSKDAIFVADPETRMLVDCNKAALEMTGYSKEELLSMRADQLHPKDAVNEVMEAFKQQVVGEDVMIDSVILTKTGQRISVSINTANVELQGKVNVMGVFRDITERKNAEKSLHQSEEKLRSIIDNIGIGVSLISPDMEILSLNRQMKKWNPHIDLKDKHICYRSFNNPPREEICSYCPTAKTLKDGLVHEDMTETPMAGQVRNYRIISSPIKDKTGKVVAAIEMVEDITERKKAEEELTFNNIILRTQQEASIDGILVVGEKGEILSFNQRFVDMWGIPLDIVESKSDERALQSVMEKLASPEEFFRKVAHLYEARDEICNDTVALKDGRLFDRYSAPMFGVDKRYYGRVWYFRDITERRKMEEEARKRLQELEVFYKASVGREERILELKKEIEQLKQELGK